MLHTEAVEVPTPEAARQRAAVGLPEAITVLLVTDLQAFTPLLVRLGDLDARRAIRAHNAALRACVQLHGGAEVTHLGDGVMAAFHSVRAATTCAAAIQHAVTRITRAHPGRPLRARIGLHAGEPLQDDGRLFGLCVNTAFRICQAARGGTVLVSDVVYQLCRGHKLVFQDLGSTKLRGLRESVRLHRLRWQRCPQLGYTGERQSAQKPS